MKGRESPPGDDAQRPPVVSGRAHVQSGQLGDHGTAGGRQDGHGTPPLFDLVTTVSTHPDHGHRVTSTAPAAPLLPASQVEMGRTVAVGSTVAVGGPVACSPRPVATGSTVSTEPDAPTGAELRDAVLERITRAATDAQRADVDRALDRLILAGVPFSANELRPLVAQVRPALIGARVRAAATAGRIVRTGYVPSTSPRTHAHPVAVWSPVGVGVEASK